MADLAQSHSSELQLIWHEIQAQSEQLATYRLDSKSEIDALKLKMITLVGLLEQMLPGFKEEYARLYSQNLQSYNPEMER